VIAEVARISGTLRSLEDGFTETYHKALLAVFAAVEQEISGSRFELEFITVFPILNNSEKEAAALLALAEQFFGIEKIDNSQLPLKASEDFSFYTRERPGAFFLLGSEREKGNVMLHDSHYDFNDELIQIAAEFWMAIAKSRLGL